MKTVLTLFLTLFISLTFAHSFHVGIAKIDYDESKKEMFATIQLEFKDLKHWIEDHQELDLADLIENKDSSSAWNKFDELMQANFYMEIAGKKTTLPLFDLEIEEDGRLFIHLFASGIEPFKSIDFVFALMMGHSEEQQNKLEFKYIKEKDSKTYFAYFFEKQTKQTIKIN